MALLATWHFIRGSGNTQIICEVRFSALICLEIGVSIWRSYLRCVWPSVEEAGVN